MPILVRLEIYNINIIPVGNMVANKLLFENEYGKYSFTIGDKGKYIKRKIKTLFDK